METERDKRGESEEEGTDQEVLPAPPTTPNTGTRSSWARGLAQVPEPAEINLRLQGCSEAPRGHFQGPELHLLDD